MNDCLVRSPMVQLAVASKQQAESLPAAVTWASVNADQQARPHEGFAEVEHADFLDARLPQFAGDAPEQSEIHVPPGLFPAPGQRAVSAAEIATRRNLDFCGLRHRRRRAHALGRYPGHCIDSVCYHA